MFTICVSSRLMTSQVSVMINRIINETLPGLIIRTIDCAIQKAMGFITRSLAVTYPVEGFVKDRCVPPTPRPCGNLSLVFRKVCHCVHQI